MRHTLKAITQTVRKVIRGEHLPLRCPSMLPVFVPGNPVRGQIPHLRVSALNVLLHAEKCSLRLILAVVHVAKLGEVRLNGLVGGMGAAVAGTFFAVFAVFAASLEFDFRFGAVAYVGFALFDEFLGEVVEFGEVVA